MTNIGKYRLEAEIGRGGFGRVYRAFDPTVGRRVAIKILIADKDKDLLTRFRREANATGKLRHKNIVTVYDYGEHENTPYLVMEYLEGEDLKVILSTRRVVSLLEKTSIMSQVAEGLQHAHHNGVVHRDIKPANIMILTDGTVKIMDFGIARVLRESTTRLTQDGNLLGTLPYMAPEVFQGADVDHLCDVFSFGAIYYELIAGKHPFAADEPGRVIYNITSVQPPFVNTLTKDCPPGLEQVIARAMHKDRELRYQSLEDLLFDLMPIRLQLQSTEAQSLIRKAENLFIAKQINEAQMLVRQVLQLDPNNTSARELRERVNREAQLQATRERCEHLIASGKEQFGSLQYSKAVETFETVLRLDPENVQALNLLEQVRIAAKKRERAEALLAQAKLELEGDQLTDAYRSILECLQYAPDNKDAASLLKTIRAAIEGRERQRRLAESLARVEELVAADKPEEAEALLSDLEVSYPAANTVKQLMAEVRSAIQEKRRRSQLAEGLDPIRKLLAQGKWSDALASLNRLLKDFPDESEILSLSAHAQEQLRAQQKAEHVEQLLRDARAANEAFDFERALNLINKGLHSYPGEATLEAMLTATEKLRSEYRRHIAIRAATERATALAARNDFSAALAEIDSAVSTWESSELVELRRHIETKREEYERAQAIGKACTSVRAHLDKGMFEDALTEGRQALIRFPGEPALVALVSSAESRLAEQKRKARIEAVRDQATASAARGHFSAALELLRNGIRELGEEPPLIALCDRIQADQKEHERRQAIAAAAAALQELIGKREYDEAVRAGRLALIEFPGDAVLSGLIQSAERALLEQKRARRIATVQEQARSLISGKDFPAALQLVRNSISELGSEPSLEGLASSIDGLRQEHEKQQAIQSAVARAKEILDSKQHSRAVVLLEESLAKYPGEAAIESLLAEARDLFAAQQRSEAIDAIVREARKGLAARDFQTALNIVRSGIKEYSDDSRLTGIAAEIRAAMLEMEKHRAIRAALDSAAALKEQGQFSKAAQLLEQALVKVPGQTDVQEELAGIQKKIAKQKEVNAALDKVCELMSRRMFDEALQAVHNALSAYPEELALSSLLEEVRKGQRSHAVAAACQKVEALRSTDDLDQANRCVDEVLAEFPDEPGVAALKSRIQAEIAEQQRRQKTAALTADARHLLDHQKVEDAIARLEAALREYPGEGELTALLAYANEIIAARRRADAMSDLAKRSKTLLQNSKPREAEKLLKDAVITYPDEESFLRLLKQASDEVAVLEKNEQTARARDKVISEARTQIAKNRLDAATKILKDGLTLLPNDVEIQAQLEQLRKKAETAAPVRVEKRSVPPKPPEPVPYPPEVTIPTGAEHRFHSKTKVAAGVLTLIALIAAAIYWNAGQPNHENVRIEETPAPKPPIPPKILSFYADPSSVAAGGQVAICYGVENASSIRIEPEIGEVPVSENRCFEFQPRSTAEYRLTTVGSDGTQVSESFTVAVEQLAIVDLGRLIVETRESGTDVFISGQKFRTGKDGTLEVRLQPDTYEVSVVKPGFETPAGQRIQLSAGKDQRARFRLTPRPTLLAFAGAIVGTNVFIDGRLAGTIPSSGSMSLTITAGQHQIELRKDGYQTRSLDVEMEAGETRELPAQSSSLVAIPPPPPPPPVDPPKAPPEPPAYVRLWEQLQNSNDLPRLEQFRRDYPGTPQAEAAGRRVELLQEAARREAERIEWERVDRQNMEALRAFAQKYPNGTNAKQALADVARLEAAQRRRADIQAILATLDQYSRAFESKNLEALRKLYPGMDDRATRGYQDIFRRVTRITYQLRPTAEPAVNTNDDTAVVPSRAVYVYESRGQRDPYDDPVSVTLRRQGAGWVIVSIR